MARLRRATPHAGGTRYPAGEDTRSVPELLAAVATGRAVNLVPADVAEHVARPDLAFVPIEAPPVAWLLSGARTNKSPSSSSTPKLPPKPHDVTEKRAARHP